MDDTQACSYDSCFTSNGDYFALLSVDGRLRIWGTTSGKLLHEFAPNSVKQSLYTSLGWTRRGIYDENKRNRRKRKKRENVSLQADNCSTFPSLAIGTEKGSLFSYDPMSGKCVEFTNENGHTDAVNCIVFSDKSGLIYTCSDDKFIVEWCGEKYHSKFRWKVDEQAVKRICLGPSGTSLLSAGCSIKLWDLSSKQLLQSFHGHSNPILNLKFSLFRQNSDRDSDDGYYFISSSVEDRVINAWKVDTKNPESKAVASFIISDIPLFMDVIFDNDNDKPVKLCAGCKDGRIHFFACAMNGSSERCIESSKTVDILMKKDSSTMPVPFINGRIYNDEELKLMLVSGISLKPSFSKLDYSNLDISSKIFNQFSSNLSIEKVKPKNRSKLASSHSSMKLVSDAITVSPNVKDTKLDTITEGTQVKLSPGDSAANLSIEDKLVAQDIKDEKKTVHHSNSKDFKAKTKLMKYDNSFGSFAKRLLKAIHDADDKLIDGLLFSQQIYRKAVLNTFKNIPRDSIGPLVTVLADRLQRNPAKSKSLTTVLRMIMAMHLEYMQENKAVIGALNGVCQLIESQEEIYLPLFNLQGKIDALCSYTSEHVKPDRDIHSTDTFIYNDSDDEVENLWAFEVSEEEHNDTDENEDEIDSDEETEEI